MKEDLVPILIRFPRKLLRGMDRDRGTWPRTFYVRAAVVRLIGARHPLPSSDAGDETEARHEVNDTDRAPTTDTFDREDSRS